jgi:hypothetical protein
MKRTVMILAVVTVTMAVALPAFAGAPTPEFLDTFAAQDYNGSDGTLEFNGPWVEIGESDGPTSGFVWVWDHEYCDGKYCLKIGGSDDDAAGHGAYRAIDLGGAASAKLCFDDGRQLLDDASSGTAAVQISPDGGDTWNTLDTISLDKDDGSLSFHRNYSIDDFATSNTVIRFKITEAENLDAYWLVDNVTVEATFATPTTTSTKPSETTTSSSTSTTTSSPKTTTSTRTTTTTHSRTSTQKKPDEPDGTTTTTVLRTTKTTVPRATTTTTTAPVVVESGLPPEDRAMMMSKMELAVPTLSGVNAMPASLASDATPGGHHAEPVEAFAAAFFTETGDYGGNLLPSIALGILIATVSLIGIRSRHQE